MIFKDDRTQKQKETHTVLVVGTDSFMSFKGQAKGGASVAGWACRPENEEEVLSWVDGREDMFNVMVEESDYEPDAAHFHVYVVNEGYPSLCQPDGDEEELGVSVLKMAGAIAQLGNLECPDDQEARITWKLRMLKAGMGMGFAGMPDDWHGLPPDEQERRLDKMIKVAKDIPASSS